MLILAWLFMAAAEPAVKPNLLNTQEIFNHDNYPYWAMSMVEEGTVRVEVQVDSAGRAHSCRVLKSSGFASLDIGTCDIMTGRGRFAPARDRNGKALAGSLTRTVTWQLMQDELWPTDDHRQSVIYSIDKNLQVSGCRVEVEPPENFDPRTCGELRAAAQMLVLTSPAEFDWDQWNVVLETSGFSGAGERALAVGKGPADHLFDRDITRMVVNAAGRITRCDTIEKSNMPMQNKPAWCDRMMRTTVFVPAPGEGDRLITAVSALYLRKKF